MPFGLITFMFSRLSDKLQEVFKDLRGHGRISEQNVSDALREVRLALLFAGAQVGQEAVAVDQIDA